MSDRATSIAFDSSAPADERTDALGEVQRMHMPTANDLAPMGALREFLDQAQADLAEGSMAKAINSNVVPFPSPASKAKEPGMQSVRLDDWQLNIQGDFWERPSAMSFDSMRQIVEQTPVLNAVISTRIRQVQRFCGVADSGTDLPGFEIRHADRTHKLTKGEEETIKQLNRFVSNCGWEFSPRARKRLRRDSFTQFMAKVTRDTLVMDSAAIELEWKRDMEKGLDGFYAIDGATIRLCTEHGYHGDDEIRALQVVDGRISTAYTFDDLIYEARNPRTDVKAAGYGYPEVELLVRIITGYLNALTYNTKGFDSNAIPKGMLHLSGNYDDKEIAAFKRYWNSMVKGVNNAWSLPVMVSKDQESKAGFEKFGVEFNEMYFSKWMTFLTSLICAVYGMSPAEINFDAFSGGSSSPLSGSDTAEKLAASKDSGLRPLLSYFENLMTDFIVGEFSDSLVFRWTGLDPEDADKKHEKKKLILSVDEMRAEEGYKAFKDPMIGAAPLNQTLMGLYMQQNAPAQPEASAPMAPDGKTPLNGNGEPINDQGHKIGPDGQPLPPGGVPKVGPNGLPVEPGDATDQAQDKSQGEPDFGENPEPDFGKSFGLPVYSIKDLQA